jgi:hypothetical protein
MERKKQSRKSRGILKAMASGLTCEQILAGNRTVTYHDVFHAAAEAPTKFWKKKPAAKNRLS